MKDLEEAQRKDTAMRDKEELTAAGSKSDRVAVLERQIAKLRGSAGWWRAFGLLTVVAIVVSAPVVGWGLGPVPNDFRSGEPVIAAEMNGNFTHLQDGVTAVEGRVDAIESAQTRRFETTYLSADTPDGFDGVLSDLTFRNLVVGDTYQVAASVMMSDGFSDEVTVTIMNGSTRVGVTRFRPGGEVSRGRVLATYLTPPFVATSTTVTFEVLAAPTGQVLGSGDLTATHATIYEASQMVATDVFTR